MKSQKGFTVMELLIVVCIIAVLVSLTIPMVGRMREGNLRSECLVNLRQLATAGRLYAADHGGRFTDVAYFNSKDDENGKPGMREYAALLARRAGVDSLFTCPALQKTHATTGFAFNHNYAINRQATRSGTYAKNMNTVKMPSSMSYFTEGIPGGKDYRGHYYGTVYTPADVQEVIYPHSDTQMVVFLDGRVVAMRKSEFPQDSKDPFWTGTSQ